VATSAFPVDPVVACAVATSRAVVAQNRVTPVPAVNLVGPVPASNIVGRAVGVDFVYFLSAVYLVDASVPSQGPPVQLTSVIATATPLAKSTTKAVEANRSADLLVPIPSLGGRRKVVVSPPPIT
jgi:hypothetical protein